MPRRGRKRADARSMTTVSPSHALAWLSSERRNLSELNGQYTAPASTRNKTKRTSRRRRTTTIQRI
jgi:hypothetical protein